MYLIIPQLVHTLFFLPYLSVGNSALFLPWTTVLPFPIEIVLACSNIKQNHSVESPNMVDPQWNIWYWGSKWNLHTVCWSAVSCEWGTTSVYFGIIYVCFIPSELTVYALSRCTNFEILYFLSKVSFEGHKENLLKISWFKIWMGFVGPIFIKLWTSSIWGFL